jgi:hypothetical protein
MHNKRIAGVKPDGLAGNVLKAAPPASGKVALKLNF